MAAFPCPWQNSARILADYRSARTYPGSGAPGPGGVRGQRPATAAALAHGVGLAWRGWGGVSRPPVPRSGFVQQPDRLRHVARTRRKRNMM